MGIIIRRNLITQDGRRVGPNVKNTDLVHGTQKEQSDADFGTYEYSGYHRNTIESYLQGVGGSPYSRQFDRNTGQLKACGISFYDRLIQRHEMLLRSTGEPVLLLRRKTTGEMCPCYDKIRHRSSGRCPVCFGTNYTGGYVRFVNSAEPDGRIFVRLSPNDEDLLSQETGLWQDNKPNCWTLPSPTLRDRDVIVRFDPETGEETWRYEVQMVTRNQGMFNQHTAQIFTMQRLDKTHPISLVRTVDLENFLVGDLQGKGDGLQDQIENDFGDGYNDGGYSSGYFAGYDHGYHDSFYGVDQRGIPDDDRDGFADLPFNPHDGERDQTPDPTIKLGDPTNTIGTKTGSGVEFYLPGYREGYKDGLEDGDLKRIETNPQQRYDFEIRRGDIPSDTLGHPNPRLPFTQQHDNGPQEET